MRFGADALRGRFDRRIMEQAHHAVAVLHRIVEEIGREAEVARDSRQQAPADAVEFGEQPVIGGAEAVDFLWPDIVRLLRGEPVARGQVAADVPEFLEVDFLRALGDFGAERRIAARAAAARDMIGALHLFGQREKFLRLRPGFVDQVGIDAVIGDHRKAEAFERGPEILRELVGGKRHGNDGNGSGHAG